MFKDQETLLSILRTKIRINFKGEITVREIAGINSKTTRQENQIKGLGMVTDISDLILTIGENEVRIKLLEMNQKYEDLEQNFNIAKDLSASMTDDWRKSELRARDFEGKYKTEKILHKDHVIELFHEFEEKFEKMVWFNFKIIEK